MNPSNSAKSAINEMGAADPNNQQTPSVFRTAEKQEHYNTKKAENKGLEPARAADSAPYALLKPRLEGIPADLKAINRWILWRAVWQPKKGKYNKIPINARTGANASSTDPQKWTDFATAWEAYSSGRYIVAGVAFVLSDEDDLFGVDFDKCLTTDEGEYKITDENVGRWVDQLNTYTEISPSGRGLRLLARGKLPEGKRKVGNVEVYETERFLTITGHELSESGTIETRQAEIDAFHAEVFGQKQKADDKADQKSDKKSEPKTEQKKSDNRFENWKRELIKRIMAHPEAHGPNSAGNWDCRALCHDGEGPTGLFVNPEANTVTCNKGCHIAVIADVFGMPPLTAKEECQYINTPQGIVWMKFNEVKDRFERIRLSNFTARITAEIKQDDGAEPFDVYEITARLCDGEEKRGIVTARLFDSMKWHTDILGARACVEPYKERYVVDAVKKLSNNIQSRTVVTHTGWRNDGDGWKFYHTGGAITADGPVEAEVKLSPTLQGYNLPAPPEGRRLKECVNAVVNDLLGVTPDEPEIIIPLIGGVFSAVLTQPDYTIFPTGTTGGGKSVLTALALNFFGPSFTYKNLPASWESTANFLPGLAHEAKDIPLAVDDFIPTGAISDRQKLHAKADLVLRAQGNHSGRGRCRTDGSLRPIRSSRGLIISTGEEIPNGESLRARMFVIEITRADEKRGIKGSVDLVNNESLTLCQTQAANGMYAEVMAAFIQWLAPQYADISAKCGDEIAARRDGWIRGDADGHKRTANTLAHIEYGWDTFLRFARACGALSSEDTDLLRAEVRRALDAQGRKQTAHRESERPDSRFIDHLRTALVTGKAHLRSKDGKAPSHHRAFGWQEGFNYSQLQAQGAHIGWVDETGVYLLPQAAYNAAQSVGDLRVSPAALWKRMREAGLLASWLEAEKKNTFKKTFEGHRHLVLHLRMETLVELDEEGAAEAPPALALVR